MSTEPISGSRSGGRHSRRKLRSANLSQMLPALVHGIPLTESLSEEQIHRVDDASMAILE